MSDKTRSNHLLSYPVIVLASGGDVDAINAVLKHYEGYIAALMQKSNSRKRHWKRPKPDMKQKRMLLQSL